MKEEEKKFVPIDAVIKRALIQMKYEEIGSWFMTHNVPLFYAHKKGFTIVDQKYIDKHPKLKKILDETVKDIRKRNKKLVDTKKKGIKDSSYFG
ncbi:MAG: hypothetical protein JSW73_02280 [Candidatus Woesearchaeota archaeon]|nr:MAG: hypothetical protein JSW73_02280 [Candidatus Woesearchaeota archaeon]